MPVDAFSVSFKRAKLQASQGIFSRLIIILPRGKKAYQSPYSR
jgi:hypothetical protein